jgi:hypothetical protein
MQEIEKDITSIDAEIDGRNEISTVQVQVSPSSVTDDTSSINEMLKDDAVPSSLPSSGSSLSWKPITASIIDSDSKANDVVTLRDIQNAVPQESQEESFVMDKIEQNDPSILDVVRDGEEEDDEDDDSNLMTSSRRSTFSKGTSLPDVLVESMQEEKRRKQQRQHRRQKTQDSSISNSSGITNPSRLNNKTVSIKSKSSKSKTIEEELFDLTNSLRPQQSMVNLVPSNIDNGNNDTPSENVDGTTNIEVVEELIPLTQAEKFANTANQMLENIAETDIADLEEQQEGGGEGGSLSPRSSSSRKKKIQNNDHWQNMQEIKRIIYSNRTKILRYARGFMLYMILPATFVAFLLFYAFGNPQFESRKDVVSNRNEEKEDGISISSILSRPSYSWIVLFFGVRQVITFSVALAIEWLVITYYQEPGIKFKIVRPMARLFIIQAHGIPLLLIFWGILNLLFLQGTSQFALHWMFYLPLGIFNDENPSGFFTANRYYKRVLFLMVGTGVAMAAKRFLIGLRFGQNSYHRYADRLTSVLKQMLRVSKLARLSELNKKLGKDAEHAETKRKTIIEDTLEIDFWLQHNLYNINDDDTAKIARGLDKETNGTNAAAAPDTSDDVENNDGRQPAHSDRNELLTGLHLGSFADGSTNKITEMLGEWEDIELAGKRKEIPSLSAIVQFGSSLGVLNSDHPFGQYFGYCPTRYDSVECSQRMYANLLKVQNRVPSIKEVITSPRSSSSSSSSSDESTTDAALTTLKFHTIALIAIDETGELDTDQVKQLMKLYRPTRDGDISLIDFCKSVDSVYKEIRKLRASVANEVVMNAAAEKLIDFIFYTAIFILALVAVGVDVVVLFGGMAALIISFSFCVGGASSDVIKGLLFILLQRPYDIGELCTAGCIVSN